MRIAVIRQGVHRGSPGRDAIPVEGDDVIGVDAIQDGLGNRFQVAGCHEVTRPVCWEDEHVVVNGAGLEGGDHLLEQLAKGKLLQFDVPSGHGFPFRGVVFDRPPDGISRLGDDHYFLSLKRQCFCRGFFNSFFRDYLFRSWCCSCWQTSRCDGHNDTNNRQ